MLVIQKHQVSSFKLAARERFQQRMVTHLEYFFPARCQDLGKKQLHEVIRYGCTQAQEHGFSSQRDVCLYLGLMFELGSYFDRDIQYPWASELLQREPIRNPNERMDRLNHSALMHLNKITGTDGQHLSAALASFCERPLHTPLQANGRSIGQFLMDHLQNLFPQKYAALGSEKVRLLVHHGYTKAQSYGLTTSTAYAVYIGLLFLLGTDWPLDPQFPWSNVLQTKLDPEGEPLYRTAVEHLEPWIT